MLVATENIPLVLIILRILLKLFAREAFNEITEWIPGFRYVNAFGSFISRYMVREKVLVL